MMASRGGGGGGTPLFVLYGYVPLDRVWFLCGLHEVYSHIMLRPNLFIYLSTRVEGLSRGLVPAILVAKAL